MATPRFNNTSIKSAASTAKTTLLNLKLTMLSIAHNHYPELQCWSLSVKKELLLCKKTFPNSFLSIHKTPFTTDDAFQDNSILHLTQDWSGGIRSSLKPKDLHIENWSACTSTTWAQFNSSWSAKASLAISSTSNSLPSKSNEFLLFHILYNNNLKTFLALTMTLKFQLVISWWLMLWNSIHVDSISLNRDIKHCPHM